MSHASSTTPNFQVKKLLLWGPGLLTTTTMLWYQLWNGGGRRRRRVIRLWARALLPPILARTHGCAGVRGCSLHQGSNMTCPWHTPKRLEHCHSSLCYVQQLLSNQDDASRQNHQILGKGVRNEEREPAVRPTLRLTEMRRPHQAACHLQGRSNTAAIFHPRPAALKATPRLSLREC